MITIDTGGLLIFDKQISDLFNKWETNLMSSVPEAAELILQGIKNNFAGQKSFDGSEIAPLKESTLKRKRLLRQPLRVFEATGKMIRENPIKKRISALEYHVTMRPSRMKAMLSLQKGDRPMAGSRRAFGINKDVLTQVDNLFKKAIG